MTPPSGRERVSLGVEEGVDFVIHLIGVGGVDHEA